MTTRRVITAGIALLMSVAALTSCSDGKPGVPGVPKYTPSATATATSATSSAATTTASSLASSSSSTNASTSINPATSGSTSTTTTATPSPTSTEPTPAPSTAANGTVTTHMDAKDMPPKPAPPIAPQLPPQAFTKTDTGAVITAMMFVEIASYFQNTGNGESFDEVVTTDCELCNDKRAVFLTAYSSGNYTIASTAILDAPRITERLDTEVRVEGILNSPVGTTYNPKTGETTTAPAGRDPFVIDLTWVNDRWLVYAAGQKVDGQ